MFYFCCDILQVLCESEVHLHFASCCHMHFMSGHAFYERCLAPISFIFSLVNPDDFLK